AGGAVGEVEVPEIGDVEAGAELLQHIGLGEPARRNVQRLGALVARRAVGREAVLLRRARRGERVAELAARDERYPRGLDEPLGLESGRDAFADVLGERHLRRQRAALLHAKQRTLLRLARAGREAAPRE